MRIDPPAARLRGRTRSPRVVVGIIFPTASLYASSRQGISNVPGTHVSGSLTELSSTSQTIRPIEGASTIGSLTFTVVDLLGAITSALRTQLLTNSRGARAREVRVYTGDTDDFTDGSWVRVETYVVDGISQKGMAYTFSCSDRSREQRVDVFDQKVTRLSSSLTATATSIVVASTSGFSMLQHSAAFTESPSTLVGYLVLTQTGEIVSYTGTSGGNTFTGVTRGLFGTLAQELNADATVSIDRRPEVREFVYLEGPGPVLDYAVKTGTLLENLIANGGGEQSVTIGAQATSWTFSAGNGLLAAIDQKKFGQTSLKITNTVAASSTSYQDVVLIGGATYVLEGWIRTSAMPTADPGTGAFFDVNIVSGITTWTIVEKVTTGTDPDATQPDCGIAADNAVHDWTYVRCKFIPTANGTARVNCNLGYGGNQSGTAWFDGVRVRRVSQLPSGWHMGISEDNVDLVDYESLGPDLYVPTDVTDGLVLRFTHLEKTDGKRFCEEQLHVPMLTYAPIDSNGVLGIRRVAPVVDVASAVEVASPNTVIEVQQLQHGLEELVNRITIDWNFDGQDFTRRDIFVHGGSIAKHGKTKPLQYTLRGLTVSRHSLTTLQRLADAVFERRAAPPINMQLRLSRSLNHVEVGDPIRATLPSVRDHTGASTFDRAVEILGRNINWLDGSLMATVSGASERVVPTAGGGVTSVLADAWYTTGGTNLTSILTIVGGHVTVNGAIAGSTLARDGFYYYAGDLTIDAGITVTIANSVQLRIRGTLTINGKLDGKGRGPAGDVSPDVVSSAGLPFAWKGWPGMGNTRSSDSMYLTGSVYQNMSGYGYLGAFTAAPRLALTVTTAGALNGIPGDLRGSPGGYGPPAMNGSYFGGTVVSKGGDGGAGAAGLALICRGLAFGASGQIDLSGGNGTAPSATGSLGGVTVYGGAGGGGSPGLLYVILDGDLVTYPGLATTFVASQGTTPQTGTPAQFRTDLSWALQFPAQPATGVSGGFSSTSHRDACYLIQYAPSGIETGGSQDETVPAPTAFVGTGTDAAAILSWVSPAQDAHDYVEVWRATTNDRTGALLVFRGRANSWFDVSATVVTRYYWIRAIVESIGASAWNPTGSTNGVAVTYGGASGLNQWTPVLTNITRYGSVFTKTGGVNGVWDAAVSSQESYPACLIEATLVDPSKEIMIALNGDPTTDASYTSLDHALYNHVTDYRVYENSSLIASSLGGLTPATGDRLSVSYDAQTVQYFVNGVLLWSTPRFGAKLYADSSFLGTGASLASVVFSPFTPQRAVVEELRDDFQYVSTTDLYRKWIYRQGSGEISFATGVAATPAGTEIIIGNNAGNDELWSTLNSLMPYDGVSLYEVGIIVEQPNGSGELYCGVEGVKADGVTIVNTAGANAYGSAHYFAASAVVVAPGLKTYRGFFKGYGGSPGDQHSNSTSPGTMYDNTVAFVRPMFIVNYAAAAGITKVAAVWVRRLGGALAVKNTVDTPEIDANATSLTHAAQVTSFTVTQLGHIPVQLDQVNTVTFTPTVSCTLRCTFTGTFKHTAAGAFVQVQLGVWKTSATPPWVYGVPVTSGAGAVSQGSFAQTVDIACTAGVSITIAGGFSKLNSGDTLQINENDLSVVEVRR